MLRSPRKARTQHVPPSELTEDANHGKARVVRERGACADFALIIAQETKRLPGRGAFFSVYNFLSHVFGMEYEKVKPEEAAALAMDERVREMGIWPASDSVAVVNGVLVIKLQEMP